MTLFGLDVLIDKTGQFRLIEINGMDIGTDGFKQIYGDDRVEKKVFELLKDHYGHVTIKSDEKKSWYDLYKGQSSVVWVKDCTRVDHQTINPVNVEQLCMNKLQQYAVFKDSIAKMPVTLRLDEVHLDQILELGSHVMIKPITGGCGEGVMKIESIRALEYVYRVKEPYIAQEYIDNGFRNQFTCIRSIVCCGQFVDAYRRVAKNEVVNLARGAKADSFDVHSIGPWSEEVVKEMFQRLSLDYGLEMSKEYSVFPVGI